MTRDLYKIEWASKAYYKYQFKTLAECKKFVNRVVRETGSDKKIIVKRGVGDAIAEGNVIILPKWAYRKLTILHELAHCLGPPQAEHGPVFIWTYLKLIRQFLGKAVWKEFRDALNEKGML